MIAMSRRRRSPYWITIEVIAAILGAGFGAWWVIATVTLDGPSVVVVVGAVIGALLAVLLVRVFEHLAATAQARRNSDKETS